MVWIKHQSGDKKGNQCGEYDFKKNYSYNIVNLVTRESGEIINLQWLDQVT